MPHDFQTERGWEQREDGREMEGVRQSGGARHRYALYQENKLKDTWQRAGN